MDNRNKKIVIAGDVVNAQDRIAEDLSAAAAIIDCVRILTALEREPIQAGDHSIGDGYVGGITARDTSIPLALHHALGLIAHAGSLANKIAEYALKPTAAE